MPGTAQKYHYNLLKKSGLTWLSSFGRKQTEYENLGFYYCSIPKLVTSRVSCTDCIEAQHYYVQLTRNNPATINNPMTSVKTSKNVYLMILKK